MPLNKATNKQLVAILEPLSEEQLARLTGAFYKTILEVLVHVTFRFCLDKTFQH